MQFETKDPRVMGCMTVGILVFFVIGVWTVGDFLMKQIEPRYLFAASLIIFGAVLIAYLWRPNARK